jgi:hypothetical protein
MSRARLQSKTFLIAGLLLLFFAFSFNAYACLVPLFGTAPMAGAWDCPTEQSQTARQFCDAFKTLGFNGSTDVHLDAGTLVSLWSDPDLVPDPSSLAAELAWLFEPDPPFSNDLLLKTTALRI